MTDLLGIWDRYEQIIIIAFILAILWLAIHRFMANIDKNKAVPMIRHKNIASVKTELTGDPQGYHGVLYIDQGRHFHPPDAKTYRIPPNFYEYIIRLGPGKLYITANSTFEIHTQKTKFQYKFTELGRIFVNDEAIVLIPLFDNRITLLFLTPYAQAIRDCIEQRHSLA